MQSMLDCRTAAVRLGEAAIVFLQALLLSDACRQGFASPLPVAADSLCIFQTLRDTQGPCPVLLQSRPVMSCVPGEIAGCNHLL